LNNGSCQAFGYIGKGTATSEHLIGITNKVIRARTIRRQPRPEKYNQQLMDVISRNNLNKFAAAGPSITQPPMTFKPLRRQEEATATQTEETAAAAGAGTTTTSASASASQPDIPPPPTTSTSPALTLPPQAIADAPMATSPTSCHTRPAMPSPPKRTVSDTPAEGSSPKQQRTTTEATGPPRPETTTEPQTTKLRITKITVQTKRGEEITAYSCEDATEQQTERILPEPIVNNTEGLDKEKTIEGIGMKQEILSMKKQQVYIEVNIDSLTPSQRSNIIKSRWVLRDKGNKLNVRATRSMPQHQSFAYCGHFSHSVATTAGL
jgi:hypothetical protein